MIENVYTGFDMNDRGVRLKKKIKPDTGITSFAQVRRAFVINVIIVSHHYKKHLNIAYEETIICNEMRSI